MSSINLESVRNRLSRLQTDTTGQDLVEYALLSGFMVMAVWAFFPTQIIPSISRIFGKFVTLTGQMGG